MRPIKNLLNLETLSARIIRATVNGVETTDERVIPGRRLRYEVQCKRCGYVHRRAKVDALKAFSCDGCLQTMQVSAEVQQSEVGRFYVLRIAASMWCGPIDNMLNAIPVDELHTALTYGYEAWRVVDNRATPTQEVLGPQIKAALFRHASKQPDKVAAILASLPPQAQPAEFPNQPNVYSVTHAGRAAMADLPEVPTPAEELEEVIRPLKPLQPLIPHTPQEIKSLTLPPLPTDELDDIDNAANFSEKVDMSFFNTKDD